MGCLEHGRSSPGFGHSVGLFPLWSKLLLSPARTHGLQAVYTQHWSVELDGLGLDPWVGLRDKEWPSGAPASHCVLGSVRQLGVAPGLPGQSQGRKCQCLQEMQDKAWEVEEG